MGKIIMFMCFMWLMTCIAGSVVLGQVDFVRTSLTEGITANATTISVRTTSGFPDSGIMVIENEHIAYSHKTDTTFHGSTTAPVIRGAQGTTADAHDEGAHVTTVPGAMVNSAAAYNVVVMTDASGPLAFISAPTAFFRLLGSFLFLPLQFLGTDLVIITYLWAVIAIGVVVALSLQLIGARRV